MRGRPTGRRFFFLTSDTCVQPARSVFSCTKPQGNVASRLIRNVYACFFCLGARETDYPAGEEVAPSGVAGPAGDAGSPSAHSGSPCGEGVLGGITVVGCEAEGAAAVPQTAGEDGESGQTCLLFFSFHLTLACVVSIRAAFLSIDQASTVVSQRTRHLKMLFIQQSH